MPTIQPQYSGTHVFNPNNPDFNQIIFFALWREQNLQTHEDKLVNQKSSQGI